MLRFEKKCETCSVAFFEKARVAVNGRAFASLEAVRAIQEPAGWRVDHCAAVAGTWLPWEPVNETAYPTLRAAKRALSDYAAKTAA